MTRKLMLHYDFMKDALSIDPKSVTTLAHEMQTEFKNISYQYVRREVEELISLKKIKKVKHNKETLLLWNDEPLKFEYELSSNVVKLDNQYVEFVTIPSKVRQMKLPLYILEELGKHIGNLSENLELMLGINAVKSNGVWYKIQRGNK